MGFNQSEVSWQEGVTANSNANIQMDFAAMNALKDQFIEHKTKGSEVIQKLLEMDETLKESWDSEAHDQFTKEIEEAEAAFTKLLEDALTKVGEAMLQAAVLAKQAETNIGQQVGQINESYSSNDTSATTN